MTHRNHLHPLLANLRVESCLLHLAVCFTLPESQSAAIRLSSKYFHVLSFLGENRKTGKPPSFCSNPLLWHLKPGHFTMQPLSNIRPAFCGSSARSGRGTLRGMGSPVSAAVSTNISSPSTYQAAGDRMRLITVYMHRICFLCFLSFMYGGIVLT